MSNTRRSEITNRGGSLPNRFPELLPMVLSHFASRFDAKHELASLENGLVSRAGVAGRY